MFLLLLQPRTQLKVRDLFKMSLILLELRTKVKVRALLKLFLRTRTEVEAFFKMFLLEANYTLNLLPHLQPK